MRLEKKDPQPSPASYKPQKKQRIVGSSLVHSPKGTFALESQWKADQTPGFKYENVDMDKLRGKARVAKILTQTKEDIRFRKLVKVDGPDPGSYQVAESFYNTQEKKQKAAMQGKGASFIDIAIKAKKHVPPPGNYQEKNP